MKILRFTEYQLNEKKAVDLNKDGKIDSTDWKIARDKAIKKAISDKNKMKTSGASKKKIAEMESKIKDMKSCSTAKEYETCIKSTKMNESIILDDNFDEIESIMISDFGYDGDIMSEVYMFEDSIYFTDPTSVDRYCKDFDKYLINKNTKIRPTKNTFNA
jgi:hypothetical protein